MASGTLQGDFSCSARAARLSSERQSICPRGTPESCGPLPALIGVALFPTPAPINSGKRSTPGSCAVRRSGYRRYPVRLLPGPLPRVTLLAGGGHALAWAAPRRPGVLPWLTGAVLIFTTRPRNHRYGARYLSPVIPAFCLRRDRLKRSGLFTSPAPDARPKRLSDFVVGRSGSSSGGTWLVSQTPLSARRTGGPRFVPAAR